MDAKKIIAYAVAEALRGHRLVYSSTRCECGLSIGGSNSPIYAIEGTHRQHVAEIVAFRLLNDLPHAPKAPQGIAKTA